MSTIPDLEQEMYDAAFDYVIALGADARDHGQAEEQKARLRDRAVCWVETTNERRLAGFLQRIADSLHAIRHAEAGGATDTSRIDEALRRIEYTAKTVIAEWEGR